LDAVFYFQQSVESMLKTLLSEQDGQSPPRDQQKVLDSCRPGLVRTDVLAYSLSMLEKRHNQSLLIQQILSEGISIFPATA
jgi:hypothetical protein